MAKKPLARKPIKKTGKGNENPNVEYFSHTKKKGKHKRAKTDTKDR